MLIRLFGLFGQSDSDGEIDLSKKKKKKKKKSTQTSVDEAEEQDEPEPEVIAPSSHVCGCFSHTKSCSRLFVCGTDLTCIFHRVLSFIF